MNIQAISQALFQYFIPPNIAQHKGSWDYQRTQLLVLASIVIIIFSFAGAISYHLTDSLFLGNLAAINAAVNLYNLLTLKRRKTLHLAAIILIGSVFSIIFFSIPMSGGILSPIIYSLCVPPIIALVFFGMRSLVQTFLVVFILLLGFIVCFQVGIRFPMMSDTIQEPYLGFFYGFIAFAIFSGILGAFYFSDVVRVEAYKQLEIERDSVEQKVLEATQQLAQQKASISLINTHLEDQNNQLQRAIADAEEARRLQTEFLRNVSHEVRTPITSILGSAEILRIEQSSSSQEATPALQFAAQHIEIAAENLMSIFSNILTLATLESSPIEVSPGAMNIPLLLKEMLKPYRIFAEQKKLQFDVQWTESCETSLNLDTAMVRDILKHLLSNAIKFTEQGTVSLHCNVATDEFLSPKILHITVSDTGIGISSAFSEQIFTAFSQQDGSKNRQYGGLGLGLSITKRLVSALQGSIRYESQLNRGTTFYVEIPVI